ncbi:VPLPA-CTERM sorting domain-containing protein [Roseibium sp. HPY-6]|uniref:VPLPA-CTERM sorting domain-containing protein n=1 Tax=Roseibium sp. HPY-6 TaxID=3229852 RepID=UPI00338D69BD
MSIKSVSLGVAFTIASIVGANAAALDLSGFTQFGAGNWDVAGDNLSVTQTQNADPGAFVSANIFIDSSFEGNFRSNGTFDDDYMGFVFGFGADDSSPFYLFDWKQGDQLGSQDGFTLARVTGGLDSIPFGNHQDDAPGYDVIASDVDDVGNERGWDSFVDYNFKLTYQSNRILIEVGGGSPLSDALEVIFDISPADVAGVSSFEAGRFGFYNFSQNNITYAGFTESDAQVVPLPAALPLLAGGLGALGLMGWRRKRTTA